MSTTITSLQPSNETKDELISTKLKFRLSQLTAVASKETIQTLSNWILFHSKTHPEALRQVLLSHFLLIHDPNKSKEVKDEENYNDKKIYDPNMCFVYWKILYEICIRDSEKDVLPDEHRFAASLPFRVSLAEHVIQPALQTLARGGPFMSTPTTTIDSSSTTTPTSSNITGSNQDAFQTLKQMLQEYIHVWRDLDCFDSISLMDEIQRIMDRILIINRTEDAVAVGVAKEALSTTTTNTTTSSSNSPTNPPMDASTSTSPQEKVEMKQNILSIDEVAVKEDAKDKHTSDASVQQEEQQDMDEVMDFSNHDDMEEEQDNDEGGEKQEEAKAEEDNEGEKEEEVQTQEKTNTQTMESNDIPSLASSATIIKDAMEYDFEAENIPSKEILPQQLMESAKAIATMQITRDLRNDNSHTLSTILNKVPFDVFQRCKELLLLQEQRNEQSLSEESILSMISDDVLDLDIASCLNNVRLHRDIILKQKQSRQDCTTLLIQSRCNFGSQDAAAAYYTSVDDLIKRIESVQEKISDAAELEGLDFDDDVPDEQEDTKEMKGFEWFSRNDVEDYRARKKQKMF